MNSCTLTGAAINSWINKNFYMPSNKPTPLDPAAFDKEVNGKSCKLYTLHNQFLTVTISNYGARVVQLLVPDKEGNYRDVSLGIDNLDAYMQGDETYFGAIVGRYANRIRGASFQLDGQVYRLSINRDNDHLHGGFRGFSRAIWDARQENAQALVLQYTSVDGEEGYPGNVQVRVIYSLQEHALEINYMATTDKSTVLNLTNHIFFNLEGEGSGPIGQHVLTVFAEKYLPVDATLIPPGRIESVSNTAFDFQTPKAIGARIDDTTQEQIQLAGGYDHTFILNKTEHAYAQAASVSAPRSGIVMDVFTTEPGMQLYTGNFMDGTHCLKNGSTDLRRTAFCLETQHFPDSPNQPGFPSTVLRPGCTFQSRTSYVFGVRKGRVR